MATLSVTLTVEDQVAFNLFLAERPFFRRRRWRRAGMLVVAGIAAPWLGGLIGGGRFEPWMVSAIWPISAAMAGLGAVWLALLPRLTRWQTARTVRRWIASGPAGALTGPTTLEAQPDALVVTSAAQQARLAWASVSHAAGTPAHLILLLGETGGVIVPRRGLPDADWAGFLAAVSARTGLPITPARG